MNGSNKVYQQLKQDKTRSLLDEKVDREERGTSDLIIVEYRRSYRIAQGPEGEFILGFS